MKLERIPLSSEQVKQVTQVMQMDGFQLILRMLEAKSIEAEAQHAKTVMDMVEQTGDYDAKRASAVKTAQEAIASRRVAELLSELARQQENSFYTVKLSLE